MKKNTLLFLSLFAVSLFANDYTISKFASGDDYPAETDEYIKAEFGGKLRAVENETVQDGRFYLRKKYEDAFEDIIEYGLYEGTATSAKNSLIKFSSKTIPYITLLKSKFYYNEGAESDEDIEIAYFDGSSVFIEGEEEIFVKYKGKMVKLDVSLDKDVTINMISKPEGAQVIVNGKSKGTTPTKFTVQASEAITIVLEKEGYYKTIRVINASGENIEDAALLIPTQQIKDPTKTYSLNLLEYTKAKNATKIKELKKAVEVDLNRYKNESDDIIEEALTTYPTNFPQKTGESTQKFKKRESMWKSFRKSEKDALTNNVNNVIIGLENISKKIDATLEKAEASKNKKKVEVVKEEKEEEVVAQVTPEDEKEEVIEEVEEEEEVTQVASDDDEEKEEVAQVASDDYEYDADEDEYAAEDYNDEAADEAAAAVENKWKNTDDYMKYTAIGLSVVTVGGIAMGVYQNLKFNDANAALKTTQEEYDKIIDDIEYKCIGINGCEEVLTAVSREPGGALAILEPMHETNEKTTDSYKKSMYIWYISSAITLVTAVTLFTIKF